MMKREQHRRTVTEDYTTKEAMKKMQKEKEMEEKQKQWQRAQEESEWKNSE